MLLGTFLTGAAAVGAAALVSSKGRNYLLGDVEQDWLANELEFDQLLADGQTVSLKDGSFVRVFSLSGLSYETRSVPEQETLARGRTSTFHQFLSAGSSLRLFGIKRQRDVSFQAEWPSPTLKEVGEAEQRLYQNAYSLVWYLVLTAKTSTELEKTSRGLISGFKDYSNRPAPMNANLPGFPPPEGIDPENDRYSAPPRYSTGAVDNTRILTADRYITGILESGINSQLADNGSVVVQVSRDVYGYGALQRPDCGPQHIGIGFPYHRPDERRQAGNPLYRHPAF